MKKSEPIQFKISEIEIKIFDLQNINRSPSLKSHLSGEFQVRIKMTLKKRKKMPKKKLQDFQQIIVYSDKKHISSLF